MRVIQMEGNESGKVKTGHQGSAISPDWIRKMDSDVKRPHQR